ncbi:PDR/VanB family oxidoreductase [Roseomonas sp. NAR14]|uniref:PDR/VanB family oxidoreductase n=1 Tax=Roseomonas acroporae TaxID=2937791 RepID=A0A9X1YA79_9PROT|nr:PDR/VanB family oxidoreductase [Roseomonas acroporae]MCK8785950.1 PDR/VanB family oxidoreductase [Roseomonas acroporae]
MGDELLEVVIARREEQAAGIVVLDLVPAAGGALPGFEAGAHVDVHVGPGLVRQYSLCGSPADASRYRLGILLDPASRGGSAAIHAGFRAGERLRIGRPRNLFPLADGATRSVLVGGGIGITPMLAMAHALDRAGAEFELHYCARERGRAAFLDELAAAPFQGRTRLHLSAETGRLVPERDLPPPAPGIHLYVCGPAGFMEEVIAGARRLGYPEPQLHREYFQTEVDTSGDAFEVELAQSGRTVAVAAGQSIVAALAGAGVAVEVSCEQGICGTCLCNVLEGEPDHRDEYLTEEEKAAGDQILLCCSRARSKRLVLDL